MLIPTHPPLHSYFPKFLPPHMFSPSPSPLQKLHQVNAAIGKEGPNVPCLLISPHCQPLEAQGGGRPQPFEVGHLLLFPPTNHYSVHYSVHYSAHSPLPFGTAPLPALRPPVLPATHDEQT